MTPEELKEICAAEFGEDNWAAKLAAELGMSERTVQRYAAGEYKIPERIENHIRLAIANRQANRPLFYAR